MQSYPQAVTQRTAMINERGNQMFPNKMSADYFEKYNFAAKTIIDVGVSRGTPFLYETFDDRKFLLIDPLAQSARHIAKRYRNKIDYDFEVTLVSDYEGEVDIHVPKGRQAMASVNDRIGLRKSSETFSVPVQRLDDLTSDYEPPFGLKIDTEGHELSVLNGARDTLEKCEFVILELSIKRRFEDGYRFSDSIEFMAEHGFEVFSFLSGLTRSPRMSDVLFVRWDSERFNMGTTH